MTDFERYKYCFRILRERDLDQDDSYEIADEIWNLFCPDKQIPDGKDQLHGHTGLICPRCKESLLKMSPIPEYDYYCEQCDEDFYDSEVNKMEDLF